MTARLWTHRDRNPGSHGPHALMYGDGRVYQWFVTEAIDPDEYAVFCAIEAQLAPFVDLPDGVELRPTATGAWLREHGEGWERYYGSWLTDHPFAAPNFTYIVRRVPELPAPVMVTVPADLIEDLANGDRDEFNVHNALERVRLAREAAGR